LTNNIVYSATVVCAYVRRVRGISLLYWYFALLILGLKCLLQAPFNRQVKRAHPVVYEMPNTFELLRISDTYPTVIL
jgi:hypothetical protein